MKLSNLQEASEYEVGKYLSDSLDLTPYQKEKLFADRVLVMSKFFFFKRKKNEPVKWYWRTTGILWVVFVALLYVISPVKYLITGSFRYEHGNKLVMFYEAWCNKLGF